MLKLLEVVPIEKEDLRKYKLHLAIGPRDRREPLRALWEGKFKLWQEYQHRKNFERDYILSLIFYGRDEWIFGGIYRRRGVKRVENPPHYQYDTELTDVREDLISRLITHYRRESRQSYLNLENYANKLQIMLNPKSLHPCVFSASTVKEP